MEFRIADTFTFCPTACTANMVARTNQELRWDCYFIC